MATKVRLLHIDPVYPSEGVSASTSPSFMPVLRIVPASCSLHLPTQDPCHLQMQTWHLLHQTQAWQWDCRPWAAAAAQ